MSQPVVGQPLDLARLRTDILFVVAYRKGGKNDCNDAEAICKAVSRPNMRSSRLNQWPTNAT